MDLFIAFSILINVPCRMKYLLSGLLLLLSAIAMAQPSRSEIKKLKIQYYQEYRSVKTDDDEKGHLSIWRFDKKGNDSLLLKSYDTLTAHYEYKNSKLMQRRYINKEGKENEKYDYQYKPDGSYMITYSGYGTKSVEWYDKNKRLIKSQSPGDNTNTYKYDNKGKLILVVSGGKNGANVSYNKYYYNPRGWLIKEQKQTGDDGITTIYEYNSNGQIVAYTATGTVSGEKFDAKAKYQYNEKGLLIRKDTDTDTGDDWKQIYEAFDYKYY